MRSSKAQMSHCITLWVLLNHKEYVYCGNANRVVCVQCTFAREKMYVRRVCMYCGSDDDDDDEKEVATAEDDEEKKTPSLCKQAKLDVTRR